MLVRLALILALLTTPASATVIDAGGGLATIDQAAVDALPPGNLQIHNGTFELTFTDISANAFAPLQTSVSYTPDGLGAVFASIDTAGETLLHDALVQATTTVDGGYLTGIDATFVAPIIVVDDGLLVLVNATAGELLVGSGTAILVCGTFEKVSATAGGTVFLDPTCEPTIGMEWIIPEGGTRTVPEPHSALLWAAWLLLLTWLRREPIPGEAP